MRGIMARVKELSNYLKLRIVKWLKDERCQRKASLLLQCGQNIVCDIWKKYRATNSVENRRRRGRPRATSKQQDRKLIILAQSIWRSTSKQLNAEWSKYQFNVCDSTVQNRFNEKGFSFFKGKTKPFLTKKHKKWCKKVWIREIMKGEK